MNKNVNIITNKDDIQKNVEKFYRNLYKSKLIEDIDQQCVRRDIGSKRIIGLEDMSVITNHEVEEALKVMKKNKTPGENKVIMDMIMILGIGKTIGRLPSTW